MVEGGRGGSIVAVTSISGFLADRNMSHYSVSKAGVAELVRVAARELGPFGITVNAVAPGTTDTPMFASTAALPGYRARVAERTALGGWGPPTAWPKRSSRCSPCSGSPVRSWRRRRGLTMEPHRPVET